MNNCDNVVGSSLFVAAQLISMDYMFHLGWVLNK